MSDQRWPPVAEQRTVLVSTMPAHEREHEERWPTRYSLEDVQREIAAFGLQPLHLDRLRGMLRQLAHLLQPPPKGAKVETCDGCGGRLVHYGLCSLESTPRTITEG